MTNESPSRALAGDRATLEPMLILKASRYDKVASWLISLLVIVGFFAVLLFLLWLSQNVLAAPEEVAVQMFESGGAEGRLGQERGFEEPEVAEVEDLVEPPLEDTVETITDTISSQLASLDTLDTTAGAGAGGNRDRRPGGIGDADVIPPWERWEIRYTSTDLRTYAKQLDFFGIELAATGGGKNVMEYAHNLANRTPEKRMGLADQEKRIYMLWRGGPLQQADRELLNAAGIQTRGRVIVQFYPRSVEEQLARLEQQAAAKNNKDIQGVRKTVFGVRGANGKYEYHVIHQQYR